MKFKVGDKVRLKQIHKERLLDGFMKPHLERLFDKYDVFTVKEVGIEIQHINLMRIEEDNTLWIVDFFEKVEEKPKVIFDDIKLAYYGNKTVALYDGKCGESYRSKHDKEDRKIGILIAVMRALGFGKSTVDKVVDVLFDDIREIDKCTTEELLKEISNRIK